VATGFKPCTSAQTCVPCCGGRPIYPQTNTSAGTTRFGCCAGYLNPGTDTCNHTPPTGYLPISC
jgi:hypothetical protein